MGQQDILKTLTLQTESNLCHLQEKDLLSYNGRLMRFQRVDKFMFLLANLAQGKKSRMCFLYPVAKREILLPLAVDLLYNLDSEGKKSRLLLYTDLIRYRYLYTDLRTEYMRFNDIFPLGMVRSDGNIKAVKKTSDATTLKEVNPKLLLTNSPDLFPSKQIATTIGCILADINSIESVQEVEELFDFADKNNIESVIFFGTDLDSFILKFLIDKGLNVWSWNEDMLKKEIAQDIPLLKQKPECFDNPFAGSISHIINLIEGVERIFIQIDDSTIVPLLQQARDYYHQLIKYAQENKNEAVKRVAFRFIGTIYAFERMTATFNKTEQECKLSFLALSFDDRINRVKKLVDKVKESDPLVGSAVTEATDRLELLLSEFTKQDMNMKSRKLLEIVSQAYERHKKIVIITWSQPYRRATEKFIIEALHLNIEQLSACCIQIISTDMPFPADTFDVCVFYGQMPYAQMHLLKMTCAKKIAFLCYPTERSTLQQQVQREVKGFNSHINKAARINILQTLLPFAQSELTNEISGTDTNMSEIDSKFSDNEVSHNNLFSSLLEEENEIIEDEYALDDGDDEEGIITDIGLTTLSIEITFTDGRKLYCRPRRHLPILAGEKVDYKEAQFGRVGERVLIVKNDLRKSMADALFKNTDSHPKLAYMNALVQSWKHVLNKGMKENQWYDADLLGELQRRGSQLITPLAIYFWRMGYVIAPRDQKDIQRIGQIFKEPTLTNNYQEIARAATRIRSIHIKLLRRINQAVVNSQNAITDDDDDVIDEEFGLYAEDFLNMISVHEIKFIKKDVKVATSKLDRLTT